jgi:hypothetical protein
VFVLSEHWLDEGKCGRLVNSNYAVCGGLFRDYLANFRGGYAHKISSLSVLHAEIIALIIAMEMTHSKN